MLGYRSLRHPPLPDHAAPDYDAELARYWRESRTWWDNWTHNFVLSLILWPGLLLCVSLVVLVLVVL